VVPRLIDLSHPPPRLPGTGCSPGKRLQTTSGRSHPC
jgi:hypothetical protein